MCYYKTDEFMQQSGRIDSQIGKKLKFEVWEQCKFRGYWNFFTMYGYKVKFESSVNSEGIETSITIIRYLVRFESSVNSEGIETWNLSEHGGLLFESSVNSEGIETYVWFNKIW